MGIFWSLFMVRLTELPSWGIFFSLMVMLTSFTLLRFLIKFSPTCFRICWWFLTKTIITTVGFKLWFSECIMPSALVICLSTVKKDFSLLFIYLLLMCLLILICIFNMDSWIHILYVKTQLLFILMPKLPQIWPEGVCSSWLLCAFDASHYSVSTSLLFGIKIYSQIILNFSSPSFRIGDFYKGPFFF